jgi:hypothetical protein
MSFMVKRARDERHARIVRAGVQQEALQAFKEKWLVEDEPEPPRLPIRLQRAPQPAKKLQKWRR